MYLHWLVSRQIASKVYGVPDKLTVQVVWLVWTSDHPPQAQQGPRGPYARRPAQFSCRHPQAGELLYLALIKFPDTQSVPSGVQQHNAMEYLQSTGATQLINF